MSDKFDEYDDLLLKNEEDTEEDTDKNDRKEDIDPSINDIIKDTDINDEEVNRLVNMARERLGVLAEGAPGGRESDTPPELRILNDYIPDKDDLGSKTDLKNAQLAVDISVLRLYPSLFPEFKMFEDIWQQYLDNIEKRLTTISGKARRDYRKIFEALLAGLRREDEDKTMTTMDRVFGVDRNSGKNE